MNPCRNPPNNIIQNVQPHYQSSGWILTPLSPSSHDPDPNKGNPLSRLQHVGLGWQLLANVFLEDVPQFVITIITRPTSVSGVLNLTASGLSLCAKIVKGISSQRAPSLATQFMMIDQDPAVTRNLFKLR